MTPLRPRSQLRPYQARAAGHVLANPRAMLPLEMGGGKTIISATAIAELFSTAHVYGALVIGTRRIAETVWAQEMASWEHTAHLRTCILRGRSRAMLARDLLRQDIDVWISNYEALPWLFEQLNKLFLAQGKFPPMNMLVFDEVTRLKRTSGKRIAPWYWRDKGTGTRMLDYFPYRLGLTGMPVPNGYLDLFGQYYAIDDGRRLGSTFETYKAAYFTGGNGIGSKPRLVGGAKEEIHRRIEDITFALTSDEIMALPPIRYNDILVDLPPETRALYDQMEMELFANLDAGRIVAANAGVASGKCRQIANGIIIDTETGTVHSIHDMKMEVLDEHLEESGGRGVVVAYQFVADRERILAKFGKDYRICTLGADVGAAEAERRVEQWNAGEYDIFLAHPASAGHGLNIQYFSNQILWFGVDYNYELFGQMNARLRRPGQPHDHVMVHRVMARDTIEDNVILPSLLHKAREQDGLMTALKRYRDMRYGKLAIR